MKKKSESIYMLKVRVNGEKSLKLQKMRELKEQGPGGGRSGRTPELGQISFGLMGRQGRRKGLCGHTDIPDKGEAQEELIW